MSLTPAALDDSRARLWRVEIADTLRLAWPMALTQLGQVAMLTTDLMLIGRLGEVPLAAAALGHTVLFAVFVIGMGLTSAVAPLAAQAYGAREPRQVRRALRVGLQLSLFVGLPCSIALLWAETVLIGLGQAPDAAKLAARYLQGMAWCMVPAWMFIAVRGFMGAVKRPEPALWITLVAIPMNGLIAYGLVTGSLGFPRLEIIGAGIATTVVNLFMCAAGFFIVVTQRPFRKYRPLGRFWRSDALVMRQLLVVGLPISGGFLLEFGLFAAAALLMGTIGPAALAAHQIALQVAAALFMIPFGISMAATVRVGHAVGRKDAAAAGRAGWAAIGLGAVAMAAMALVVIAVRHAIPALFLGPAAAESEAARLAASLLLLGAGFAVFDGVQTVAAGALRGFNDTRMPLLFSLFSYWAIGFASSWLLAFRFGLGAQGIWVGLSLGLAAYAALLVARFRVLTRSGSLPAVTTA